MDARILSYTAVFLTAWAAPAKVQRVDFRSTLSIGHIVVDRASPAYAALEDSRAKYVSSETKRLIAEKINPERLIIGDSLQRTFQQPVQPLKLQPLIISQTDKQDHLAKLITATLEDPAPPTAVALAEVLVKEELVQRANAANTFVRKITTEKGEEIVITKSLSPSGGFISPSVPNSSATTTFSQGRSTVPSPSPTRKADLSRRPTTPTSRWSPQYASHKEKDQPKGDTQNLFAPMIAPTTQPRRYVISGPFTFSGGVAYTGRTDDIRAHQIIDGLSVSEASVNLREGDYAIEVDELAGEILAELRTSDGQVMGQGRVNLFDLNKKYQNIARIKNIPVTIKPVFDGASGLAISAASYGNVKYTVPDARMFIGGLDREIGKNKSGLFEDAALAMPSNYLIRAQHQKFWPTLSFAESGEQFQMRLFPNRLVDALLDFSLNKFEAREAQNEGIIWGRVTYGGRPVEGAKIFIVGENGREPVYFNGLLPDKTKTATTIKGEFAFTRIQESEKLLRVSLSGTMPLPTLVPVAERHVSYADLEIEPQRTIEFKSYDAFSEVPRTAILQPLGTDEKFLIPESGVAHTQLYTIKGITLIEADAGEEYLPIRMTLKSGQNELHFKQIRDDWLEQMRKAANIKTNQTAVVGFVLGDDFEVILGAGEESPNQNIVYFDAKGQVSGKKGVAGGGFVVFNLPRGLRTLTLMPDKAKKVVTQTVYVDEYAVHISRVSLMF